MPRYIVLSSHGNGGGKFLDPGDLVELEQRDGNWRTGIGLVKPYAGPPPEAPAATGAEPPTAIVAEPVPSGPTATPIESTTEAASAAPPAAEPEPPRRRSGRN